MSSCPPRARWQAIAVATALLAGCGEDHPAGPAYAAGLTEPCNLDSGYTGDDLCIRPPEPELGFQLHFGPEAYDEASVEPFLIYPGEESTECVLVNTPNEAEAWISSFHGRMRPGTHHMITYSMEDDLDNTDEPGPCNFGFQSSQFLLGSQNLQVDMSSSGAAPEHAGYAMRIGPQQQTRIELHYINTTNEPILRESWINVGYMDPDEVTKQTSPLFWIAQIGMTIPARAEGFLVRGTCAVPEDAPDDLEILVMTGHFHSSTVRMSAWLTDTTRSERCTDGAAEGCTLLYEGYDYVDPGGVRFNSVAQNPTPDRSQNLAGGDFSGNLHLEHGQRIDWECEVDNPWDFDMGFANEVDTAEMCNVFGNYAPSMNNRPWACIVP
jgi:hypothetical protein